MEIATIGFDIAMRVFQAHGVEAGGKAVLRRKLQQREVLGFFKGLPPWVVGIEACGTAHHWVREIKALGHEVRLMPASYLKPWVKREDRRGRRGSDLRSRGTPDDALRAGEIG